MNTERLKDHLPLTSLSVLKEAGQGQWDRFWTTYLEPCLREIALELRRVGLHHIEAEELLDQFYLAIAKPAKFREKYREQLRLAGQDSNYQGNLPAKFLYLLSAVSGDSTSMARFRTLLRRVIRRSVLAELRKLIDVHLSQVLACNGEERPDAFERPAKSTVDAWADQVWINQLLRATCQRFFHMCDASKTKARKRYARLLYHSLVDELTQEDIGLREGLDRSGVSRQLAAAEEAFSACLQHQYQSDEKDEVQRALADQNTGLIAFTYREEYRRWYEMAPR